MKRYLYAVRLWCWFAVRPYARYEPFSWYLQHYDKRQAIVRGEDI